MKTFICSMCGKEKDVDCKENHHDNPEQPEHTVPVCRKCHKKYNAKQRRERMLARSKIIIDVGNMKVKSSDLKLVYAIANEVRRHPELKYRVIAEKFGTTVETVKVSVFKARKRGFLPKHKPLT